MTIESLPRFWDYTSYFIMEPHGEFVLQYLGSTVLAKATSSGLGTIQKPLRDSYFDFKKQSGKKSKSKELKEVALHINGNGLAVIVAGVHPGNELFYDMQSISFFEAVRFTTVKGHDKKFQGGFVPIDINRSPNTGSEKLFTPLDKKNSHLAKVDHPPLLALVMRRNSGVRALECHGFVCDNEDQALHIVSLIAMFQSRSMDPGRPEFMRQPSDPNYEREPPLRRPDLIQPAEDQRHMQLTDEHLRGPRHGEWEDYRPEGPASDRYTGDPYGPPGPREGYPSNLSSSGRFDNRYPPQNYDENVRYRHEREHSNEYKRPPSNEFHHERQPSNEIRRDRPPSDYRYERQPSMEYRHDRQPSSEFRHERQPSSEFRHERQMSSEYRHERQGSGDLPRGDNRYSKEGYDPGGRQGRPEARQDDYRLPRVMSPGRVPPTTAPKPPRAMSPTPGLRTSMEDRYMGNEPPVVKRGLPRIPTTSDEPPFQSPTRERPPSFKGPEYSASSLESRQDMDNQRIKPVARVPPHLVAGVKVLPTGFTAALQKKQEEKKSPRSPKQERYAEEDPYDNAMSRKEFYERESKKDYNPSAPPDLVPRDDQGRRWEEDYNDYDVVIRRDQENHHQKGPGNYRYSAPPGELGKPQKPWSYDEQFQKYAQEKGQSRSTSSYDTSRDPQVGDYRHGEIADMFSQMNVQNPVRRPEVTNDTNFEQSLGYFP